MDSLISKLQLFTISILLILLCTETSLSNGEQKVPLRILFIGSSHFGYNSMPEKVRQLALKGQKDIIIEECITYGWTLSMHAENPGTYSKIKSATWDYVFLQGANHYIAKPEWHYLIKPYVKELKKAILQNSSSTKIFFMMPWAYEFGLSSDGYTDTWQEMSEELYQESTKFAKEINISIAPAGWAWFKARTEQSSIDLYLPDQGHPNNTGSYLLACVLYSSMFAESCEGNSYHDELSSSAAKFLQKIASETVMDNLSKWNISRTTSIDIAEGINSDLTLFPNPVRDMATLKMDLKKDERVNLEIVNTNGVIVRSLGKFDLKQGVNSLEINIKGIPAGCYFITVGNNEWRKVERFIVSK